MPKKSAPEAPVEGPFLQPGSPLDPVALVNRELKRPLPKRFYKEATAQPRDGAFVLLLDGRMAKTPGGNPLALPTLAAAQALAAEWSSQGEFIDPASMPLTRIVNSAIDGVAHRLDATVEDIAKYAGADLVCYRASQPDSLVRAQAAAFDPILTFARESLDANFICTEGVMFVEQPLSARIAVLEAVTAVAQHDPAAPFALAALHVMTSLTGSVLIALAVARGALTPTAAWSAAHVDEDYEMRAWGEDSEALQRRGQRWVEMDAAARLLQAVHDTEA